MLRPMPTLLSAALLLLPAAHPADATTIAGLTCGFSLTRTSGTQVWSGNALIGEWVPSSTWTTAALLCELQSSASLGTGQISNAVTECMHLESTPQVVIPECSKPWNFTAPSTSLYLCQVVTWRTSNGVDEQWNNDADATLPGVQCPLVVFSGSSMTQAQTTVADE